MNHYAQIGADGICFSQLMTSGQVDGENIVPITEQQYADGVAGMRYVDDSWEPSPPLSATASDDPRWWWIDVGPFYDRFGGDGVAIAASDSGACRAVQTLTGVRKYIDLKDPKVAQQIDMLIALQEPRAVAYLPNSGPMTATKKAAILTTPTTEAERHIKGL